MLVKFVLFVLAVHFLGACSSTQSPHDPALLAQLTTSKQLLDDEQFEVRDPELAVSTANFLALPEDIRQYLDQAILPLENQEQRYRSLRNWAFEEFQGDYEYDPSFTSALENLEDNKRINCFSFSNMFVAAARYAGIPANFQLVDSPPQWDINQDNWVVSQHINVTGTVVRKLTESELRHRREQEGFTGSRIRAARKSKLSRIYVVDLNPEIAADSYRSTVISDAQALSLFYSNKSVEALLNGTTDSANKFGKLALLVDDKSPTAWNNLGVLLSRAGKAEEAKQAYTTALTLDPDSESSANNLERVYRRLGETDKADAMAQRILQNRMKNPYYHYSMGERMVARGDLEDAVGYFKDAIKRKDDERLFYYALAETQIKLADYRQATKNLKAAKKYSKGKDLRRYNQLYSELESAAQDG
jgi:tetratricopeptide (TPR) repeat protein